MVEHAGPGGRQDLGQVELGRGLRVRGGVADLRGRERDIVVVAEERASEPVLVARERVREPVPPARREERVPDPVRLLGHRAGAGLVGLVGVGPEELILLVVAPEVQRLLARPGVPEDLGFGEAEPPEAEQLGLREVGDEADRQPEDRLQGREDPRLAQVDHEGGQRPAVLADRLGQGQRQHQRVDAARVVGRVVLVDDHARPIVLELGVESDVRQRPLGRQLG